MLFVCMGICVLSPAHESEMRGYLVYVLIEKKLMSLILFKFSHSLSDWTVLSGNWGGGGVETFLKGSVDLIIYRDYIVNRRFFFIYCSLATHTQLLSSGAHTEHSVTSPYDRSLRMAHHPHAQLA